MQRLIVGYMLERPIVLDEPEPLDGVVEQSSYVRVQGQGLEVWVQGLE